MKLVLRRRRRGSWTFVAAGLTLLFGMGGFLIRETTLRPPASAEPSPSIRSEAPAKPPNRGALHHSDSSAPTLSQSNSENQLSWFIGETLVRLRAEADPEKKRAHLERLRSALFHAERKAEAVEAILGFLRSGDDAIVGTHFRVGPRHALAEAPTVRTALLDWLGLLDPKAGADFATEIFEAMTSPEEYALALRSFARGRPDQRRELAAHFDQLLNFSPWSRSPSPGYLESFDVVPYLGDPMFLKLLESLMATTAPVSLRHASLLALDNLVIANPNGALAELSNSRALEHQPLVRASFLARADVRDAAQRAMVEGYLLSPSVPAREIDKFMLLFPNANRFLSHSLLTETKGVALAEIAARDAAALAQVRLWQTQPRFAQLKPRLSQLEDRLRERVASAVRGGHLPSK